ncbi:Peritrophin-1 [Chionoecetes opilio]|uniref:Peritrophin-1 n=1 Tax=Chionoecetes opilio TaxID=41210 RepID=A0A8J8WD79_CHIOP|nr:Peritrophin-1 [Chionoecetes opilio]
MMQKFSITGVSAALGLLLLAVHAQGLQVCPSLSCPTPSGFFAHPSDCGTYVTCSDGDVDIKQCPEGLHFNPVQRRCDYPKLVQCNITARLLESGCSLKVIVPRTRMQEDVVDSSVACDCECCFKPHDVCTKYYECDEVCDWPASAGCTSGPDHNCELPTPIPTIPEPNATVPTPSPLCDCECCHKPARTAPLSTTVTYEHQSQSYHQCSDGLVFHPELSTCVYANMYPECVVIEPPPPCLCNCFYPSEICTSFYHCDDGTPVMMDCPGGLYWNQDMKSCDMPELVNCTMPVRHHLH